MLSLQEKVEAMNALGYELSVLQDTDGYKRLAKADKDHIWLVADGLAEQWVMNHIEGRVSLQSLIDVSVDDIEKRVEQYTKKLKQIQKKMLS